MLENNNNASSNNANQNATKISTSNFSSSSQKIDPNQSIIDASTNKTMNNNIKNVANNPRVDLQRIRIHLEGYRQICFDGIPRFPNPILEEMRKRLPNFGRNNTITCKGHLRSFLDMMSDYEVEDEDVIMKLFV